MALTNGQELNYARIAADTGVPHALLRVCEVLKDTLIAWELIPFMKTKKTQIITRSKIIYLTMGL